MIIDVVTLFPEMFGPVLEVGMTGRALRKKAITLFTTNPRIFTTDSHQSVDDAPYGGGMGMVMQVDPLFQSLAFIEKERGHGHKVLLCPTGTPLQQKKIRQLSALPHLILLCGRYEGFDERVRHFVDEEISLGDFILSGGELAAMAIIDAMARLQEGVLSSALSTSDESFEEGMLEYPQYTRPKIYQGMEVPDVLLSGNHELIRRWRKKQSLVRTQKQRPDLFEKLSLSKEDLSLLNEQD